MDVSDRFFWLIEQFEGFSATRYRDTRGLLTIGFGHLIKPGEDHSTPPIITRTQAETMLRADVREAVAAVNRLVKVPLRQSQFDALVSFVFNIGQGAFERSTLLADLNVGGAEALVEHEWRRWTAGGVPGLVRRREAELALWKEQP